MNQVGFALLSIIIYVPIVAGIVCLLLSRGGNSAAVRAVAIAGSLVEVALTLWLYFAYEPNAQGQPFQFVENAPWMPQIGVSYHLGVDGLSMFLVIMTAVVTALVVLFASPGDDDRAGQYFFWLLALESAVVGVFMALDLILFYIFFEAMLVPMYFIIGGWGGPRRQYAAVKFFLYTLVGSLLMLVAIIGLRVAHSGAA
ncbi:MAG TPA: proton-conducting transporter membrane subunit, partial [Chloroflexota bacterium]